MAIDDLAGLRVFIVEDESLIMMLLEDQLLDLGCEIAGTAARLDEALIQARVIAADVAMLDINLAGQFSYPVAKLLRERGIPCIFSTGYGAVALPADLQGAEMLAKPFRRENLLSVLQRARALRVR